VCVLSASCGRPAPAVVSDTTAVTLSGSAKTDSIQLAPDVTVIRIAPRAWMHVTTDTSARTGHFPSNGILLENDSTSTLFDTGWTDAQTVHLLRWADTTLKRPIRTAVFTHAHLDRLGGLRALAAANVRTMALDETVTRVMQDSVAGAERIEAVPGLREAPSLASGYELFYPGKGHASDNIVVWMPASGVLFGGCLIKSDTTTTLGSIASADLTHWPSAVAAVQDRYADASVVVPGHGARGGQSLLTATHRLLIEKLPAAIAARAKQKP